MPENVNITTLASGLRIVTNEMASVETTSAGIWVDAGARFEAPNVGGVSHVLEHMTFKGTKKRTAQSLAEEIENVGGHINAYTSRENTAYYAKTLKEDLGLAIDIVSDLVINATLDNDEFERERGVILQEINQANDTPDDVVFDLFQLAAYPDQPLGRPVLGYFDGISAMERDTMHGYMKDYYRSEAMVLAAAGKLKHDEVVAMAESHFADTPTGKGPNHPPANYKGGELREIRDIEQVHIVLGFEGINYHDDDYYAAGVLSGLFGGGMSSRLFQEVREKRGLVYSVYSFFSPYADSGLFGVYAGTGEKETAELIPVITDELSKLNGPISSDEIIRAKAQIKSSMLMGLESTSSRAEQLARQISVFGRHIPIEEALNKIEAVDEAAIRRVAKRFMASPPTLSAVGPIGKLESFDKIKSRLG
ncbi:MAG: insulinase family protein [Rhodospirillaceae bacterium]|nr:insulinase family protein [Rhodospirillaceae bacterium]